MKRSARTLALFGALAIAPACERKAPGPAECRRFALSMHRLRSEEELGGATRRELALRDQVDGLTRECLVLPYDHELVRCIEEQGRPRACRAAFDLRRARGSKRMLSH